MKVYSAYAQPPPTPIAVTTRHPIHATESLILHGSYPRSATASRSAALKFAAMTAEHDRLYGSGTGQAVVKGAYLKNLPRAFLSGVNPAPKVALSPPACKPNQLMLGPVQDLDGFSLSVDRKRQDGYRRDR